MSLQNYQLMKKISPVIELRPSLTQNLHESPEDELKYISSNTSFEATPHKTMIYSSDYRPTLKKDCFTLNGWENPRDAYSLSKSSKAKYSQGKYLNTSGTSKVAGASPKRGNLRTLELKVGRNMPDLNFKYGAGRHKSISARGDRPPAIRNQCSQPTKFQEHLSKEKVDMMHFYRNERIKRRLMNEMMEPQQSICIIEYPLEMGSGRPSPTSRRKLTIFRRYFN